MFFATVLPRHSLTSALVTRLLVGLLSAAALKSVAEALGSPFALETFYRLRQRVRRQLDVIRVSLCREQPPPVCGSSEPLHQTIAHLQAVCAGDDVVAAFQQHFQRPWLG